MLGKHMLQQDLKRYQPKEIRCGTRKERYFNTARTQAVHMLGYYKKKYNIKSNDLPKVFYINQWLFQCITIQSKGLSMWLMYQ